nr:ATP-dependent DNA ligase [Amycolatopsis aidingensis]
MRTIEIAGHELRVGNEDKVFYPEPGLTKADVVDYYRRVAEVMVPHLRGRPLTLRRFPDGVDGEGWFQKEASGHFPDWLPVRAMPQRTDESSSVRHVVCEDAACLVYLADQASLELHVWPSTVDNPERPDRLVLDIDPPEGVRMADLRDTVRRTRDLLTELGLAAFLQATGGSGYHVVSPLDGNTGFDTVRALGAGGGRPARRGPARPADHRTPQGSARWPDLPGHRSQCLRPDLHRPVLPARPSRRDRGNPTGLRRAGAGRAGPVRRRGATAPDRPHRRPVAGHVRPRGLGPAGV